MIINELSDRQATFPGNSILVKKRRGGGGGSSRPVQLPWATKPQQQLVQWDMYHVFHRLLSTTHFRKLVYFTKMPLIHSQQLPAPYRRLIDGLRQN